MKPQSEWFTREIANDEFNGLLNEHGWVVGNFTAYSAAKKLKRHPNPDFYAKFRAWEQSKLEENTADVQPGTRDVPAMLRERILEFGEEILTTCGDQMERAAILVNQAADRRVVEALRTASVCREDREWIITQWTTAEGERDTAQKRVVELEEQLVASERAQADLTARLEEKERLLQSLIAKVEIGSFAKGGPYKDDAVAASAKPSKSAEMDTHGERQPLMSAAHVDAEEVDQGSSDLSPDDRAPENKAHSQKGRSPEFPRDNINPNTEGDAK